MSLKKLSLAAALSIGIMSVGAIAKADQTGAACPICPAPKKVEAPISKPCPQQAPCYEPMAACPCPQPQVVQIPVCPQPQPEQIGGTCLNCSPNAKIIERQAYAFPSIGRSAVYYPEGDNLMQIGGSEGRIAAQSNASLALVPEYGGALSVIPKEGITGAASPITAYCPEQIKLGPDVHRCYENEYDFFGFGEEEDTQQTCYTTGQAAPCGPCASPCQQAQPYAVPMGAAVPLQQCDPCSQGLPVQVIPVAPNPCQPCDPCQAGLPMGQCCPVESPCQSYSTGAACPVQPMAAPMQIVQPPACDSCAQQACPVELRTSSGIEIQKTMMVPVQVPIFETPTGAACPACPQFPDVSNEMYAGCDINTLASKGVLAGYPDRTYKPNLPIIRSEFASAMVSGLELQNVPDFQQQIFTDVPTDHWANSDIDKAYNRGLMAGYPDDSFKPNESVSRAEALATMAKAIPGDISQCDAQKVLESYIDSQEIPNWAALSVAESINAGLLAQDPNKAQIRPNESATRSDVASMIEALRTKLALDPCPQPVQTGAATQLQPQVVSTTIPTMKVKFNDILSARTGEIGDRFVANTTEPLCINGVNFPVGSEVKGEIVEVVRPGIGQDGAIRIAFKEIKFEDGDNDVSAALPSEILSATVIKEDTPNILGRLLAWPFSWPGKVAGVAGRTVGGVTIVASNMVEGFLTNFGNGTNELFNAELRGAGRSYLRALVDLGEGVLYTATTALSGATGILKESADEIAYVVNPDGQKIAKIQPDEIVSVAFGCFKK